MSEKQIGFQSGGMSRCMFLLLVVWAGVGIAAARAVADQAATLPPPERYIRYGFTVQNTTDQLLPQAELWVCAPLRKTSTQELLHLDTSRPCEERTDQLGNHLLRFVFSNMPPYALQIVTIEATLALKEKPGRMQVEKGRWLKAELLFEYDDEAFKRLAPEFPGVASEQTARTIYDWVRRELHNAGFDWSDRGALYALQHKRGDSTEYATLFAALCRRSGIPARVLGGYRTGKNKTLEPVWYRHWAEIYLDGKWIIADPQAGLFNKKTRQYVALRVLGKSDSPLGSSSRFRCIGEGIKAEMKK